MTKAQGTPRISHVEIKAGVFLTFCLALFIAMLFVLGKFGRSWRGTREVRVIFTHVRALPSSAPVFYNGMEAGHVKKLHIVHATPEFLGKLPPFTKRDLPNLPLQEDERDKLARVPDGEVDALARAAIADRSMVLLLLEVLSENDEQRFRVDDEYRIIGSLMGDNAVEIRTGSGAPAPAGYDRTFLGVSGDMYTDMGNSLAQVRDILSSLADVIGDEEGRGTIQDQFGNFNVYTKRIDDTTASMITELPQIWDSADAQIKDVGKQINDIDGNLAQIRFKLDNGLEKARRAIDETRHGAAKSVQEAHDKIVSYHVSASARIGEWKKVSGDCRETIPAQVKGAREWTDGMIPTVERIDSFFTRADDQLDKGAESTRSMLSGYIAQASKAEEATYYLKKWPGSLTNKPDDETSGLEDIEHRYDLAHRQYLELRGELERVRQSLQAASPSDKTRIARIDQILRETELYFRTGQIPEKRGRK